MLIIAITVTIIFVRLFFTAQRNLLFKKFNFFSNC